MKPRVQAHLITQGVLTETGLTRTARPRRCPRCRAVVLACIDTNGIDAWTDPTPVDPHGELLAILAGRRTWHRTVTGGGLAPRIAPTITAKPADRVTVHVEHRCGDPTPPPSPTDPRPGRCWGDQPAYDHHPFEGATQ